MSNASPERDLQAQCVQWFRSVYKPDKAIIFSVPNEATHKRTNYYKGAGVLRGVSDLIIVFKDKILFIEMKCKGNYQTLEQKTFQAVVEHLGYQYYVCRSFDEFQYRIRHAYDKTPSDPPKPPRRKPGRRDQKRLDLIQSCVNDPDADWLNAER